MSVMILDAGNSIIKTKIGNSEIAFPHAIQSLTEGEYEKIISRASIKGNSADSIRVNGKHFVINEITERHGGLVYRAASAPYTRDYYGILAVAALARLYERGREVPIFGSHAPGGVKYREDLMKSVLGEWTVKVGKRKTSFNYLSFAIASTVIFLQITCWNN